MDLGKMPGFFRLFERQAAHDPDRLAVLSGEATLTYGALDARSNQLGHYLRNVGIAADDLVGICVDRTALLPVGLLGILKAGAAYVPLDAGYPPDRLRQMLDDADVRLTLTQSHLAQRLGSGRRIVCLDDWSEIGRHPRTAVEADLSDRNIAYVVYTSGSSGGPKGVAIEHRGALSLMHWAGREFGPDVLAGVLASSSVCFDMSVFEIFAPLSWGGSVILANTVMELPGLCSAQNVTLLSTVPSAGKQLASSGYIPDSLKSVLLAGEALPRSVVDCLFENSKIDRIWNLYGVSEDTSYSTSARIDRGDRGPVTIGLPITDRDALVLNGDLDPVPVGETGELYLGGVGLARGYLGRPDLTAARFIPHPASGIPGSRMYRTGDLARMRSDGRLECLGRIDHQLKIRGYRIEPGEIEAVLQSTNGVRACAVVAQQDGRGEKFLSAFVVLADPTVTADAIRRQLATRLPSWMLPAIVRVLEALPLTPSGKIDRRTLSGVSGTGTSHSNASDDETPADRARFRVVANREEQFAIWPAARNLPDGWVAAGPDDTLSGCLAHIAQVWTDMRPASLKRAMGRYSASTGPASVTTSPAVTGMEQTGR
jgi:amino acid adenylation domain-containing protein